MIDLELYAQQLAWLHAKPKDGKGRAGKTSRLSSFGADGKPPLPPVDHASYILEYAFEVGPDGANGAPLEYRELYYWSKLQGLELTAWESSTIMKVCKAYMSQYHKSDDRNCPAPYIETEMTDARRDAVADKMEAFFQSRRK